MYSAMSSTRSVPATPAHARLARLLKLRLVDALALQAAARQAHWAVRGPNFVDLHGLFDQLYENVEVHVDELTTLITAMGGTVALRTGTAAENRPLQTFAGEISTGHVQVAALADRLAQFARMLRATRSAATRLHDPGTSLICTGMVHDADKYRNLLKAHLSTHH